MTKQELVEEIANIAGGLDIAEKHMALEALPAEAREAVEALRKLVHENSETPMFISGD